MSGVKQFVFSSTPLLWTHVITNTNSPSGGCPQLQESTVPSYVIRIKKTVRAYLFESHATCRLTYAESLIDLVSERPKAREESHQLELVLFSHAFVFVFFYWQRC